MRRTDPYPELPLLLEPSLHDFQASFPADFERLCSAESLASLSRDGYVTLLADSGRAQRLALWFSVASTPRQQMRGQLFAFVRRGRGESVSVSV